MPRSTGKIVYREDIEIVRAFGGIMAMKRFAVAEWLRVKKGDYEGHIPGAWKVPQIELEALGLEPILRSEALRLAVAEHDDETSTMKHRWIKYGREQYEECERCGLRRRKRSAGFGKRIIEYWIRGEGWTWVKSQEPVPKCQGKG